MPSTRCIRKPASSCASYIWRATVCGSPRGEGLQSRHPRPESHLSGAHRRSWSAGAGNVRQCVGQPLSTGKPELAGKLGQFCDVLRLPGRDPYTTNAIESLNSVIRHAVKKRKVFPTDDSVKKVVWLATQAASQKHAKSLRNL